MGKNNKKNYDKAFGNNIYNRSIKCNLKNMEKKDNTVGKNIYNGSIKCNLQNIYSLIDCDFIKYAWKMTFISIEILKIEEMEYSTMAIQAGTSNDDSADSKKNSRFEQAYVKKFWVCRYDHRLNLDEQVSFLRNEAGFNVSEVAPGKGNLYIFSNF